VNVVFDTRQIEPAFFPPQSGNSIPTSNKTSGGQLRLQTLGAVGSSGFCMRRTNGYP
jgi:hypothetical protein